MFLVPWICYISNVIHTFWDWTSLFFSVPVTKLVLVVISQAAVHLIINLISLTHGLQQVSTQVWQHRLSFEVTQFPTGNMGNCHWCTNPCISWQQMWNYWTLLSEITVSVLHKVCLFFSSVGSPSTTKAWVKFLAQWAKSPQLWQWVAKRFSNRSKSGIKTMWWGSVYGRDSRCFSNALGWVQGPLHCPYCQWTHIC
jgi:hypothetical protein